MTGNRDFVIRLQPLADDRPVEIRLRRLLKFALRSEKLRCTRVEAVPQPPKPEPHGVYTRQPGGPWKLVKRVGTAQAGHSWILDNREQFSSIVELTVLPLGGAAAPTDQPKVEVTV